MDIPVNQLKTDRFVTPDVAGWDDRRGGGGIGLDDILQIINARIRIILGTAALVVTLVVAVLFKLTPIYTATTEVVIGGRENQVVDIGAVLAGLPMNNATVQNQIAILTSGSLLEKLVRGTELDKDPEFNPAIGQSQGIIGRLNDLFGMSSDKEIITDEKEEQRLQTVVGRVRSAIRVNSLGRSSVIEINVSSVDSKKAADIANALSELYILDQLEAKFDATQQATAWLNERIGQLADQVRQAENAVEFYRVEYGLTDTNGRSVAQQQLAEFNSQLSLARAERAAKEAKYTQAKRLLQRGAIDSIGEVLASPLITNIRQQEAVLIQEQGELEPRYGDRHPRIIDIRSQRRTLSAKINEEAQRIVANLANQVAVVNVRERSLEQTLNSLKAKVTQENQASVQLRELERDAEASRILYETFLTRFKQVQYQEEIQTPDARIISTAFIPQSPSFPQKRLVVAFALPASLILGFMLALALERLENGFRIDSEIERHLHIPSLGLVPHMSDLEAEESLSARVINKPLSSYTESIRALRFGIDLFDVDDPPKVILVTSPLPNEGKTTLACSLARLAAASGQNTLLLDADLRHPTVHRTLGIKQQSKNLTDFLSTPTDIESMTSTDSISPLKIISLGSNKVSNPSNLLASDKMKNLISTLRDAYDLVIIDSAPLMPVTDTRLLARLADVSLFAVRWQKTPREAAKSALRLLIETGVPIVGAAMTFVDMRRHALYGYGYGAAGYYGRYYSKYYED